MPSRSHIRVLIMAFLALTVTIAGALRFHLFEHIAYKMERGHLRALRESLTREDRTDDAQWANRMVPQSVIPAVVSIETDLTDSSLDATLDALLNPSESGPRREGRSDTVAGANPESEPDSGSTTERETEDTVGMGSGFVFDAERGYILTNAHVVSGAKEVRVRLADGRSATGEVLGSDAQTDLAVVHINLSDLHEIPLAKDDETHIGEEVFAAGTPFGLEGSFTKGIISARTRHNVRINGVLYDSLLQTDAVITSGSSGGPLVDLRGKVIGVSTAMATHQGEYEGVGFAIPVQRVREMKDALIDGGPGFLGVWVGSLIDPDVRKLARERGWSHDYGVFVKAVIPHTGAARAGLQEGDIILSLDHRKMETPAALGQWLAHAQPGRMADAGIWRADQSLHLSVEITRRFAPR